MRLSASRFGRQFRAVTLGLSGLTLLLLGASPPDDPPAKAKASVAPAASVNARRAVEPIAPKLPAEVVSAMQDGAYPAAIAGLERLSAEAKTPDDRAYMALIKGIAQRLAGQPDGARGTWQVAIQAAPGGRWASKMRFELAAVELAAGRFAAAEEIARVETETLLAGVRKDRLAEVYYAYARRLLRPDDPITPADPNNAYALLVQARALAKGESLRAKLLFEQARAAQAGKKYDVATRDFQAYLHEYKSGEDRPDASFHLGEVQLTTGQALPARLTWTDLAAELAKAPGSAHPKAADIRAKALYQIAITHGVPNPPDDTQLNLGVAALRRFLAAAPAQPWAVRADYQIGASYLARGKSEQAIEALTAFLKGDGYRAETDEARRDLATLAMTATFQIAQILQSQAKHSEAITAFEGYLAKFPNGPQSADAQRSILDVRLAVAQEKLYRKQFAEARTAWAAFVAQNPLDGRVPQVLFQVGESFVIEEKYDEAIAAWDPLLSKFPGSEPAAHAQFDIASIYEVQKGNPETAIERFRKVTVGDWVENARQRIAVMEARLLTVVTPRTFRSGETAHLKVTTRNLETLTFTAYKLNAESYFRKKHLLGNVELLDVSLVAPNAEWTVPVKGYGKYKPIESTYDLKVETPGVYVVKVTDEKHLQATTLVLGSDVDAIVKVSRDQLLIFAQDMKTGKGRPNARILVSDGSSILLEKTTGPDGVCLTSFDKPRDPNTVLQYLVLDGGNVAGSGLGILRKVSQGLSARAYLYTDRPAYRPGDSVSIRGVVREIKEGQYANPADEAYRLEVFDVRGRLIVAKPVKLSSFGTFNAALELDSAAPVGAYRVRLFQPGKSDFSGVFEVQSYKLEKMDLAFDLPRTVYYRGETIKGEVVAKFQYGGPVANRAILVTLPDGRRLSGQTDAAGKFKVEFETESFAEEQTLRLAAVLPQDNVGVVANVTLAVRAFNINLATNRDVYLDGESFQVKATTVDAQGEPTGQALKLSILKQVAEGLNISEREVAKAVLTTDAKTGLGTLSFKVDDADGGSFVVRAAGTDRFGNAVVSDRVLTISGKKDVYKLRLLADRQTFKVGETAAVVLHSRSKAGTALLTWEAERVLSYRLVEVKEGENPLTWVVDGAQFPNFTLTAGRMVDDLFDSASLDVLVQRDLRVTIAPTKPTVGPGEEVELDVMTVDQLGKPVAAEISVALVDRSLLRLFGDKLPEIGPFFYSQTRTGAFNTASTNTFSYNPGTLPVAEAVVEEASRTAALEANQAQRAQVVEMAKSQVERKTPAPGPLGMMGEPGAAAPDPNSISLGAQAIPAPVYAPAKGAMMGRMGGGTNGQLLRDRSEGNRAPLVIGTDGGGVGDSKPSSEGLVERSREPRLSLMYKAKAEKAGNADKAEGAPRERFVETAYWNPAVVTGIDGKARVKFKAPQAMSAYRFTARGTTGADSLVGQAVTDLVVKKDFFVDLKAPSILTQSDRPRFIAQVNHVGVSGKVDLTLTTYAAGRQLVSPKPIEVKGDGVTEVLFEPFDVPDGDVVRLSLKASAGEKTDELVLEIPIRPWGAQAIASASGTSSNGATVFVGLPAGRSYESPEMLVVVSPTVRRMLVELALGRGFYHLNPHFDKGLFPVVSNTVADRASDLIAAAAVLNYLGEAKGDGAGASDVARLTEGVQAGVSELVTLQNDDGGWPWVAPRLGAKRISDPLTSARAALALHYAASRGLLTDQGAVDRAMTYLTAEFSKINASDSETRAAVLHALSTHNKASFELANSLNRVRQNLSDVSLAYLAMTMSNLNRQSLAEEILNLLATRAKSESAGPGQPVRKFWQGANQHWHQAVETTALVVQAFGRARPGAPETAAGSEWLLAHRSCFGWEPHKAKGPAVAALVAFYGKAGAADDRYRLVVTVNDAEVYRADIVGAAEGQAIAVPRKVLKLGDPNRVRFLVEGRGTFGYSVMLTGFTRDFGPDQRHEGKPFTVNDRMYLHADPELDGKTLPTGFATVVNPKQFSNKVTQVGMGGQARVRTFVYRQDYGSQNPVWERPALVVEESLPAGTTLIEGSVQSSATSYDVSDNTITFYFAADQYPNQIQYDVFGYLPGQYRALPTRVRDAYNPGKYHLGPAGELRVLSPGEPSTDPYKATPDELFARGKGHFDAGRLAEAAGPLEELSTSYTLRDDILKQSARMLLTIHIKNYQPRKVVQDFEILKEKAPDVIIPFEEIAVVGRAYRDINEHERAYLVWRAITEASYLEDAQVGEVLRQKGKTLDSIAYLLDLWREYPNSPSIEADFFGVSQILAERAGRAFTDPALRKELADAGVTRSELLLQAIRLIQIVLSQSPKNPLADEASLALVGAFLELEDYKTVVPLAIRFAKLYPKSTFLDSFQYSAALALFNLGRYDEAVAVAERISKAIYKDANGVDQPSQNKWQAIYILGQIYDARRQPGKAVDYYKQVADKFTDAAGAVRSLTRKDLKLPEVSLVRLATAAKVEVPKVGLNFNATPGVEASNKPEVKLDYRNIAEADVKVYPVDLMRLYLTRRNLDAIAGIDLAGITPLYESTVKLGDGQDFADKLRSIDLPLTKEGAYLVMIRGGDLYASGIVLVSPLELEVLEEADSGRVRVTVRDAKTKDAAPKVQVKVIGTDNPTFFSGQSDLRGVFVAEGVRGQVTAVARRDLAQYAFYRGTTRVGALPPPPATPAPGGAPGGGANAPAEAQSLDANLKSMNGSNQLRQLDRLQKRYQGGSQGVRSSDAY